MGFQHLPDDIIDTFFTKIHGKPYFILDEASFRQTNQLKQLPPCLALAVYATTIRFVSSHLPEGGLIADTRFSYARTVPSQQSAKAITEQYAAQSRSLVDVDEPSIESLQTLLLLSMAFYAVGKGKKAYTTLCTSGDYPWSNCLSNCTADNSVSMAYAMDLHREAPMHMKLLSSERELRRRLFWACYIMDRFNNCGSKRPSIISDSSLRLKLPSFTPHAAALPIEGKPFNDGPNLQFTHDPTRQEQGAITLLIDAVRILGMTNHYLAGGGVAGDHHFPWHASSTLSKIRNELNIWATSTQNCFASVETLFGHPDSTTLFLSKLVYHITHILIYRNFLPINLNELRGSGQHQSWQIEATNQCFLHANLTAELVEMGRRDLCMEWPAFVGYCICTAGSVHVHGQHYQGQAGEIFAMSGHYLQKEYEQLTMLSSIWSGVVHQKMTLETIAACHAQLVNSQDGQISFSPVYLEDFFDRYPGYIFEGPHVSFKESADDTQSNSAWVFEQTAFMESVPTRPTRPPLEHRRSSQISTVRQPPPPQSQLESTPFSQQPHPSFANPVPPQEPMRPPTSMAQTPPSSTKEGPSHPAFQSPFTYHATLPISSPALGKSQMNAGNGGPESAPSPFVFPFSPVTLEDIAAYTTAANGQLGGTNTPYAHLHQQHQQPQQHHHHHQQHQPDGQSPNETGSQNGAHPTPSSNGDPFLKLLEELAQNEQNQGGPSELDFFLNPVGAPSGPNGGENGPSAGPNQPGE